MDRGERKRLLYSLISAEVPDGVKDIVVQDGMDCTPMVENGYANWDHMDGPAHLIGEPLSADRTTTEDDALGTVPATESRIWLYTGHPEADATWTLIRAQEAPESRRRLGTSVQGEVVSRQGHRIEKSRILHLAISHQPLMPLSFVEIAKSMRRRAELAKTQGADPALQTLNLDTGGWLYGPCEGDGSSPPCYRKDMSFRDGPVGLLRHLVKCRHMAPEAASRLVKGLHRSFVA